MSRLLCGVRAVPGSLDEAKICQIQLDARNRPRKESRGD